MKNRRNHYQILHVQADAPAKVIKSSYRTLMQQLNAHPDRGGESSQAALINGAYSVLSNAVKRAEYDRELKQQNAVHSRPEMPTENSPVPAMSQKPGICFFCKSRHQYEKDIPLDAFCGTCKSPLCLVEQSRLEKFDQRKVARIGKQTVLSYYTHWPQLRPYRGVTENISKHGMLFNTSRKVSIGDILKIDCTQFQSIVCVANCRQAGNIFLPKVHVGVRFLTLYFKSSRGVFVSDTA